MHQGALIRRENGLTEVTAKSEPQNRRLTLPDMKKFLNSEVEAGFGRQLGDWR